MRSLTLSKTGLQKLRSHLHELKADDFEDSLKSLLPGEWCKFISGNEKWIGFVNSQIEDKYTCAYVLSAASNEDTTDPEVILLSRIRSAYKKRQIFKDYSSNARMIYGSSDGLPGLIVDQFLNASIIQINTAGMDCFRDLIFKTVREIGGVEPFFLDNPKYRAKEFLPTYQNKSLPELRVDENGISFKIRPEVLQKVGFYYDHRENRLNLINIIRRMKHPPVKGIDLFCYAGAWGISALKSGVNDVTFVDQGDFEVEVMSAFELNKCTGKASYVRSDVFKYLDDKIKSAQTYELILSDPPAFAKSSKQKNQALDGYSKLHRKVLRLAAPGCLLSFSSCTQYVSHDEFQKNISDAAYKENRKMQLLYSGIQGFDHPVSILSDRSNYIKSYLYIVE